MTRAASSAREQWIIAPGDPTCVCVPGVAKPIKCGSQKAAALIVAAVNAYCRGCKGGGWIETGTPGERIPCDCGVEIVRGPTERERIDMCGPDPVHPEELGL